MPASPAGPDSRSDAGFGLYVHWPFCARICPYCDFNVYRANAALDEDAWTDAYVREIAHFAQVRGAAGALTSVYFGGGTPSLMPPRTAARVLDAATAAFGIAKDAEITLEANPTSSDRAAFRAFRSVGVNRLSLGVQALSDDDLRILGRDHTADDARRALARAAEVFPRTTFDLIYGRPGQTVADWTRELGEALALAAGGHLSLYQLTIEAGTAFHAARARGRLDLPDDDALADFFDATQDLTAAAGLRAYEVSNHARAGEEGRHNLTYWRYGEYLGVGPGAHGRLDLGGRRHALAAIREPAAWLAAVAERGEATASAEPLDRDDMAAEVLLTGLRLAEGLPATRYAAFAGRSLASLMQSTAARELVADGFLAWDGATLRATSAGRRVLDSVLARMIEAGNAPSPCISR